MDDAGKTNTLCQKLGIDPDIGACVDDYTARCKLARQQFAFTAI